MTESNNIPKHWQLKKLGEVCEVVTGTTPPKSDTSNYGNAISFFKPPHLWDELISDTEEKLSLKGGEKARLVPPNTVLVTCIGNLGRTGFVKKKAAFNQQLNAILENENIGGKFIFYQAQSPVFRRQLEKLATGTTVSIVNKRNFETILIPIPPLPEQLTIVAKIEELFSGLDNGIAQLKTAQQQLKVYRQSLLKCAFEGKLTNKNVKEGELPKGWKVVQIKDVAETFGGYAFKSGEFLQQGRFQVLRMGNVRPGLIRYSESPIFLNDIEQSVLSRALLKINDVIITQTGTRQKRDYGFTVLIQKQNLLLNQRIASIRFSEKYLPKFFLYFSWTDLFKDQFFANETGNVGQGNVGIKAVTETLIPCPSLKEQQLIVSELESKLTVCDKIEETISQSLQQAETLRQSILKKAFEGKLVKTKP